MTDKKTTKKEQAAIDNQCEALCDEVAEISALQARILRGTYRDKLTDLEMRRITRMPVEAIQRERAAAMRTVTELVTGGILSKWSTPAARDVPEAGEKGNDDKETEGAGT